MNRKLLMFKLLLLRNGRARAEWLRKKHVFYEMGEHCYWHPYKVPHETYLMKLHNNVFVASNVSFITHDIMENMFNWDLERRKIKEGQNKKVPYYVGKIEIFDNVFIGANSTILYNVRIGPNAIVAAGSVVVNDVPEGSIVGGNPARVIGKYKDLLQKRQKVKCQPICYMSIDSVKKYYWEQQDVRGI